MPDPLGTWMLLESKGTKKATAEAWHQMKRHIGVQRGTPLPIARGGEVELKQYPHLFTTLSKGETKVCFYDGYVLTFSCKELQVFNQSLDLLHLLSNFFQIMSLLSMARAIFHVLRLAPKVKKLTPTQIFLK